MTTLFLSENVFMDIAQPIIDLLNMIIVPALLIVGALGSVFCIVLGVKYAKAEEPQDREKAKHSLKNAIIGFLIIFVLLVGINIALPAMTEWYTDTTGQSTTSDGILTSNNSTSTSNS